MMDHALLLALLGLMLWLALHRLIIWLSRQRSPVHRASSRHVKERLFTAVFEDSHDAIFLLTREDGFFDCNTEALRIFGFSCKEEVIGLRPADISPPLQENGESSEALSRTRDLLALQEGYQRFEWLLQRRNGATFPADVMLSACNVDGRLILKATIRDISAQKRSAQQYRYLFTQNPAPMLIYERDSLALLAVNEAFTNLYGYSYEEAAGLDLTDLHPEEDRPFLTGFMAEIHGYGMPTEWRQRLKDGRVIHVVAASHDTLFKGQACRAVTITDITARKGLEDDLRKMWLAVEQSPSCVLITNTQGEIEYVNRRFLEINGFERAEVIGQNPRILQSGETPEAVYAAMWDSLGRGQPWSGELINRRKQGGHYTERLQITPVRSAGGEITHYLAIQEDITEQRLAEKELEAYRNLLEDLVEQRSRQLAAANERIRRDEERYAFAMEATNDGLWDWDMATGAAYVNASYYRMLGYAPDDLQENAEGLWTSLLHPEDKVPLTAAIHSLLQNEGSYEVEFRMRTKDGGYKWILSRAKVVAWDEAGKPVRVVGTHIDLTARKQLEIELRQAKEQAEAANQAKSAFVANMSHEIRTPMNAILGYSYVLSQRPLGPPEHDLAKRIISSGEILLSLINDILDFSKIEAGKLNIEQVPFQLGEAVASVAALLPSLIGDKPIAFHADPVPKGLEFVEGDALKLKQILINLLSNAVKFTRQGNIALQIAKAETSAADVAVRFVVRDTGIGIPKDKQTVIFSAFSQADGSTTRRFGGTGLGLSISQHLVELMGGEIGVISEPDVGSEFWFILPFKRVNPLAAPRLATAAQSAVRSLQGVRILVVDDNPTNLDVASLNLREQGAEAYTVADGEAALNWLKTHPGAVDVVFMDMQMPSMDGCATTQAIRTDLGLKDLPVIALTANSFPQQRAEALAAGMNGFVSKPFNMVEVIASLAQFASPRSSAAPPDPPRSGGAYLPALDDARGLALWKTPQRHANYLRGFAQAHADAARTLGSLVDSGDTAQGIALAHKLRGEAGNLALAEVARHAAHVESALRQGDDPGAGIARLETALAEAVITIACFCEAVGGVEPIEAMVVDAAGAASLLPGLLEALRQSMPNQAEKWLYALAEKLPAEWLAPIQAAVNQFDFAKGETLAAKLAAKLEMEEGFQGAEPERMETRQTIR